MEEKQQRTHYTDSDNRTEPNKIKRKASEKAFFVADSISWKSELYLLHIAYS